MADYFADTSGLASLADASQLFNTLTRSYIRSARRRGKLVVTTNYVLAETISLLASPLRRPRAAIVTFIDDLKNSPTFEIIHIDPPLDDEAWQLYKSRPDKEWSLVDCTSFVLMTRRGITEALTTDHHFEQAGFVRLLK